MSLPQSPSGTVVHEVEWSDALPWWILFRAAGAAFSPTVILLAALGSVATWAGWSVANQLGLAADAAGMTAAARDGALALPTPTGGLAAPILAFEPSRLAAPWLRALVALLPAAATDPIALVALPFRPDVTLEQLGGAAARIAWFLLVWSIFGTGITRHVALRLVGEEAPGPLGATLYGSRKWLPAFNSVVFVLVGILILAIPGVLLGAAMRTEWGLACAGAVWPLVLLAAVVLAILAIGVVFGWPLMVAAVGVERADSFQAISTAFSYLYQRPLHYGFYAVIALLIALPAIAVAGLFADATATLAMWAVSLGMGHDRTAAVLDGLAGHGPEAATWGVKALGFWARALGTLLASFGWGYFWAIATAAYLLLRFHVDGTEMDEVVIDEPGTAA